MEGREENLPVDGEGNSYCVVPNGTRSARRRSCGAERDAQRAPSGLRLREGALQMARRHVDVGEGALQMGRRHAGVEDTTCCGV